MLLQVYIHFPTSRRELHGIRQQVPKHLLQSLNVSAYDRIRRFNVRDDLDLLRFRSRSHSVDRRMNHEQQIHWLRVDAQLR